MSDSTPALIPLYKHMRLIGYAIVDADDGALLSPGRWTLNSHGYAVTTTPALFDGEHLMHRIISRPHTEEVVDHINNVRSDNRKANLRNCTQAQNAVNVALIRAKSGYRGVSQDSRNNGWYAAISINGVRLSLGAYLTAKDAAQVYDSAARQLRGEFAVLNFPDVDLHGDIDWRQWVEDRRESHAGQRKLRLEDARDIRRRVALGERAVDLAKEFRVSPGIISHIVAGRSYPEPPTPEGTERALERVAAGEAVSHVAKSMGMSVHLLRKAARAHFPEPPPVTKKQRRSNARLTQEKVDEIRRRVAAGEREKDLAPEFGVSLRTVTGYTRYPHRRPRSRK